MGGSPHPSIPSSSHAKNRPGKNINDDRRKSALGMGGLG
jgi:hypothetical protein